MKKIVLLKIVYDDGTSLKLEGEDARWLVRQVDALIEKALKAANTWKQG